MSELTPCNYCSLSRIKRRAEDDGFKVTIIPDSQDGLAANGMAVYVHSPDVTDPAKAEGDKYWTAWMMEVTDHCVC